MPELWYICGAGNRINRRKRPTDQRRGARAVEWGGLENRCALLGTGGSNPSPSARTCANVDAVHFEALPPAGEVKIRPLVPSECLPGVEPEEERRVVIPGYDHGALARTQRHRT